VTDVQQENQNGLTIRTMEVLFSSGTPLLITNVQVKRYDLYARCPALVWDESKGYLPHPDDFTDFAKHGLFDKYSIDNWVRVLLYEETPDYTYKYGNLRSKQGVDVRQLRSKNVGT